MEKFISYEFEHDIKINVVEATFPKLIQKHQSLLNTYMYGLIQMISTSYYFHKDKENFYIKLKQNNYKDLRWLLLLLLPFINQNVKPMSELTDFNELYSLRYDVLDSDTKQQLFELKIEDINLVTPKYVFSNVQFGRTIRNHDDIKSIQFNEKHIKDNYYLILDTIKTTRYKLYINWIDILPFKMNDYNNSPLYIDTKTKMNEKSYTVFDPIVDYPIEKSQDIDQIKILNQKLSGLNIEDIYNTISLDLYDSILNYKWLIFDIGIRFANKKIISVPLLYVLDILVSMKDIFKETSWENLHNNDKERFEREWKNIIKAFESNLGMSVAALSLQNSSIRIVAKSIAVFFDRGYSNINSIIKEKKYLHLEKKSMSENIDDYDEERLKYVSNYSVLKTLKSIDTKYIYDFFLESIQGFKNTWYSKHLLNIDKTQIASVTFYKNIDADLNVSFKNVYNFCKSIIHEQRNLRGIKAKWESEQYIRFPATWSALNERQQNIFLKRLNNVSNKWFNIRKNIWFVRKLADPSLQESKETPKIYRDMKKIYNELRNNIADILFETMISRGTMSYMVAETDLTDASIFNMGDITQKSNFVNTIKNRRFYKGNHFADNSYYYLTNKPFSKTGPFYFALNGIFDHYDYFKLASHVSTAWYTFVTYHWVAQIGFCHRFMNNRINYITGGTGAGKTSQVPKLYMYFLKAIDKIDDPTVIVTVPRTNLTTEQSTFVSHELAVPFVEFDEKTNQKIEESKNNNYYVQYKHASNSNAKDGNWPKIRYITDGSILQDAMDPLMKSKYYFTNTDKTTGKIIDSSYIYSKSDKYDVIIMDEAHEHNTNMDMILTMMRNTIFYNNKLRLVIMSATMDADEPTYRRFYRDINDNRKYPLNNWIAKHKLDRVNTERRFHISPPDEKTRFKITEIDTPEYNKNPETLIIEIMKSTTDGHLLFFLPGSNEINSSIEKLNSHPDLPHDVIAIPYYTEVLRNNETYRNFTKNLDTAINELRISKTTQNITLLNKEEYYIGDNNYTRAIIVATNAAEVGLTIKSLKYVVDSGLEKTLKFDFERRANIVRTNYISEASRLQRRGRVGRVAPGTVYYLYDSSTLKNNIKQFSISTQDIHISVLLTMIKSINDIPIFPELVNAIVSGINVRETINKLYSEYKLTSDEISLDKNNSVILNYSNIEKFLNISYQHQYDFYNKDYTTDAVTEFIDRIIEIILSLYCVGEDYYEYYGNPQDYDYNNSKTPANVYFSGFDPKLLTDSSGQFYIIHPDELVIKRNINGDILQSVICTNEASKYECGVITKTISTSKYVKNMISNKFIAFWESLLNKTFIGISSSKQFYRTTIGDMFIYCIKNATEIMGENMMSYVTVLFFGYGLSTNEEEFEQILNMVSMLKLIGDDTIGNKIINREFFSAYANKPGLQKLIKKQLIETIKKIYSNKDKLIRSDISFFLNIINAIDYLFKSKGVEYNILKSNIFNNDKFRDINIKGIITEIPPDLPQSKDGLTVRDNIMINIHRQHINDLLIFFNKYKYLFENTGLNINFIEQFIEIREQIRYKWNDIVNDVRNIGETAVNSITKLKYLFKNHRMYMNELGIDITKGTFMLTVPYNVLKKIPTSSSSFVSLYNPHLETIMSVIPSSTFVDPIFNQDLIIYFIDNPETKIVKIIISLKPSDLNLLANIYNIKELTRKFSDAKINSEKLHLYADKYLQKLYDQTNIMLDLDETLEPTVVVPKKNPIDYRNYSVPEHLTSITNITYTIEKAKQDIDVIQSSRIWDILNKLGIGYFDYGKLIKSIN